MTRILIVEDEPNMVSGLRDNFEFEGYDVITAPDGVAGLERALNESTDLVILDVMMPRMSGLDVCKQLKAKRPSVPIIMLTARGQEVDKVVGLELGADDYVTKPFSIRELLARVKAFLRRQPAATSYQFGKCRLDLTAHKVFRNGKEIDLTAKEFRLLEFFVKRPGRALTRDSILDGVWGNEVIVTDRSVDRCVTTLRSKIEDDPHNPGFIQTIRDIGYRFEP